jgi:hypothetical protein
MILSWCCQLVYGLVGPIDLRSHRNAMLSLFRVDIQIFMKQQLRQQTLDWERGSISVE